MVFKWDPRKAASNLKKHGIDFHEAATVLDDTLSTTFPDTGHSSLLEPRFLTIGMSSRGRILVVAHTERNDTMRIITARGATPHERRFYEEG
ncbi:MAG: BrnT family toxin [Acidobacteria bacterium]|nr:BrnT family toxin [Acidobacteriota bacterium]